jgi:hypothetical protein
MSPINIAFNMMLVVAHRGKNGKRNDTPNVTL